MSRLLRVFVVSAVCATWIASSALAQPEGGPDRGPPPGPGMMMRGGFGGGPMFSFMLLGSPKVQKELALTDDQKEDLQQLRQELRPRRPGDSPAGDSEDRRARMEAMQKQMENAQKELAKILKPEQLERLKQIRLQVQGAAALMDPEISKALGITSEQQEKLQAIGASVFEKMRDFQGSREQRREQMTKIQEEVATQTLAVLTEQQRQAFEKMKGEKLDIDPSEFRPGRPGRGGGPRPID